MIGMGLSHPGQIPGDTREKPLEVPPTWASASASASAREGDSGASAALPAPRDPGEPGDADGRAVLEQQRDVGHAEVVVAGRRPGAVARVWHGVKDAAREALRGSVWRARPAALRDINARIQRAEWAPTSTGLLLAGQAYGYAALVAVAVIYSAAKLVEWAATVVIAGLYALAEGGKRPLRLAVAALIVLIPLLVTVL